VREPAGATQLVDAALEVFGRVDALVCNAATHPVQAPIEAMRWEDFSTHVLAELAASYHITQAVLPVMQEQRYGRLVYVSSNHSEGPASEVVPLIVEV
jgi:3-oxoacyl-[acyl-carrier protein] reductase